MENERVISYERGRQLADQLGIEFFETSAKDNVNVKVMIFMFSSSDIFMLRLLGFFKGVGEKGS